MSRKLLGLVFKFIPKGERLCGYSKNYDFVKLKFSSAFPLQNSFSENLPDDNYSITKMSANLKTSLPVVSSIS